MSLTRFAKLNNNSFGGHEFENRSLQRLKWQTFKSLQNQIPRRNQQSGHREKLV